MEVRNNRRGAQVFQVGDVYVFMSFFILKDGCLYERLLRHVGSLPAVVVLVDVSNMPCGI